jgi:hypothetical protein
MKAKGTNNRLTAKKYQSCTAIALLACLQMCPSSSSAQSAHRTPKDSFLSVQADSVSALVHEIATNSKVQSRYAALYKMPANDVAAYMRKNVEIGHLSRIYQHTVYCVTPSGVIFTERETLKTDEKVFALRNGQPVLRWACGNPLARHLPSPGGRSSDQGIVVFSGFKEKSPVGRVSPAPIRHSKGRKANLPAVTAKKFTASAVPSEKIKPYVTVISPAVPAIVSDVSGPAEFDIPVTVILSEHVPLSPFIAAVPIAVFGSTLIGSGTRTGSPGTLVPYRGPSGAPNVPSLPISAVPEPSSAIFWMLALGFLLGFCVRAHIRKHMAGQRPK